MAIRGQRSSMLAAGWMMFSDAINHSLVDAKGRSSLTRNENHLLVGWELDRAYQAPAASPLV